MSMGGVVLRGIPPGGITVSHPIQTGKTREPPTDPGWNEGGNNQQLFNFTDSV